MLTCYVISLVIGGGCIFLLSVQIKIFPSIVTSASLLAVFILSYPLLESPSLTLMLVMYGLFQKEKVISKSLLLEKLGDEELLTPRLRELINDNLVILDDKLNYTITNKGKQVSQLLSFIRIRFLGKELLG